MNASYTIRREAEGLPVPFGNAGVAGAGAVILGFVGLAIPIGWIESLSFHLYLDTITSAAAPPLGTTARILFALALATLGGAAGYVLARLFKVVPSDLVDVLLARLRGLDRNDEADAPVLRSADRHPDAPARRPFSPIRDIDERDTAIDDDMMAPAASQPPRFAGAIRDDEDELLLDGQFAGPAEPFAPATAAVPPTDGYDAAGWPVGEQDDGPSRPPLSLAFGKEIAPAEDEAVFDLPAPTPEDWERASQPVTLPPEPEPEPEPESEIAPAEQADFPASSQPAMAPRAAAPQPQPLDLSAARLDELIARLESGFARKVTPPAAAAPESPGLPGQPIAQEPALAEPVVDDPAFPHDPALAAALATLRKLNRAS
jgi:hypothetical protein